jgi:hypothetical protein
LDGVRGQRVKFLKNLYKEILKQMSVGYVSSEIYQRHETGNHVEGKDRLTAIDTILEKTKVGEQLLHISPRPAGIDEIAAVHDREYIRSLKAEIDSGGGWLDPDTYASPGSWEAAIYAAGGVMSAVEHVMEHKAEGAFPRSGHRDITPCTHTRWVSAFSTTLPSPPVLPLPTTISSAY